ncbi:hypothetical protein SHI21_14990 [Bacteriovorax sp. PP10]|uniref:Outer membrane lipoprotein-sorting protein n=1 Tax=Bacteriovorax antarcticus TaxID=3088717 RepID=A0ABU5VWU3_9BACT|nr:hypothetical protein [Bacteriovorax sp. PP10]MEA9357532.1 hypothetical protein [Bacteriovorax sp. PP10]
MKHLVLIFCLLIMSSIAFSQENVIMKGEAFDKDNKLVYVETHNYKRLPSGEISAIKTTYHNAAGKLIADVSSDFSKDPFIPDTIFIDHRFNEKQELSYNKDSKLVSMKITDMNTGKFKSNEIKRTENMVSGQGFHNYILKNFNEDRTDIKFIVLPKLDYYSFYFEQEPAKAEGQRRFILKISSWVLRILVKEIAVDYRMKDHSLLTFEGLTNIDSDKRDSQILKIKMSYPGVDNDKKSL